ncbi:MAG: helix-turn-helix transcriptional regulator [Pyrinomonadaceae bacterium]|nr:helix-turn-helix transcriptional regulator [Sphingobacteriaceae bacterium]
MYGTKIRMIRELRGLSQENVAEQLGIAQNTYSKIESNQTKLSTEMLAKIADIFDVSPMDIMTQQPAIINFQSNQGTQHAFGHINTFVSTQKELFGELIKTKDSEIDRLQTIIDQLLKRN